MRRQRLALIGLGLMLSAIVLAAVAAGAEPFDPDSFGPGQDARAYWEAARVPPYTRDYGSQSAYPYSPAFLQAMSPLISLPWSAFLVTWTGLLMLALLALVGPLLFAPALLVAMIEIWGGNITLLLALAIVAGFRWPAAWAFVLLTKVTPGVGLLWFAVRREWRSLVVAAGATAGLAVLSWLVVPQLWQAWINFLLGSLEQNTPPGAIGIPPWVRLPIAAGLTIYAARTDRKWLMVIAATMALPVLWYGGLTMVLGVVALHRREFEAALIRLVSPPGPARRGPRLNRRPLPEG